MNYKRIGVYVRAKTEKESHRRFILFKVSVNA